MYMVTADSRNSGGFNVSFPCHTPGILHRHARPFLTIIRWKDVVGYFMSVHIYKYRLQWIYVRNVSSGINARFCVYCAHFPGIDTPSQKMHDDEVSKLEMWLVVEELGAHQAVMAWGMVFGVVVPEVGASGGAVNLELALAGEIPDPVEAHLNLL